MYWTWARPISHVEKVDPSYHPTASFLRSTTIQSPSPAFFVVSYCKNTRGKYPLCGVYLWQSWSTVAHHSQECPADKSTVASSRTPTWSFHTSTTLPTTRKPSSCVCGSSVTVHEISRKVNICAFFFVKFLFLHDYVSQVRYMYWFYIVPTSVG